MLLLNFGMFAISDCPFIWLSFDEVLQVFNLLLGQSKIPTASRRSRSFVFAVCGVHGTIVHEHGWPCSGWLLRCGEDTSYCPSGDIRESTNGCSFYTRRRSPYYTPLLSIGRTYRGCLEEILPVKRHGRSEFMGHGFVTIASITMKHGINGVGVTISRCRNFHKNTRNFTESNKSLKTNLILKNKIV